MTEQVFVLLWLGLVGLWAVLLIVLQGRPAQTKYDACMRAHRKTARKLAKLRQRHLLRPEACSHWPRDPVILSTGEQVAFICRKCDHTGYNNAWLRAEDLTRL